ncbi:MAG TPA: rod shape-determining protein MreD [Candidatus Wujingus californicus]|uniref:rod shape-determining protein MreD n=1 Tax=Candidatus Wujingus californicus TaxID=3367618 RepID=UPI001D8DA8B9|nr:rod shape-determining protein MreD [Planctomycetota bacterium]
MRWITFFCILLCISLFQSTLINWINIGLAVPDLYFPLVVFYSFTTDFKRNTITSWCAGMAKDLFSEGSFGVYSVFFVAVGFLLWSVRGILFRGHLVTQIIITFIFSLVYNLLYAVYTAISFNSLTPLTTIWIIFICSLYTAFLVPIMFLIFNKFQPAKRFFINR